MTSFATYPSSAAFASPSTLPLKVGLAAAGLSQVLSADTSSHDTPSTMISVTMISATPR